ncbi:MAG: hypothetical protein ACT4NX_03695 [Deltaproteobacteria bacterium]
MKTPAPSLVLIISLAALFIACKSDSGGAGGDDAIFRFDFSNSADGWTGGFADYPEGEEDFFELDFGLRDLPSQLGASKALFISGNNHSDDLFMFVKRRITGLEPGEGYLVRFEIEIASEAGRDCVGIGGPPAIAIKAGASAVEPLATGNMGFLEMNIDKGNQSAGGADAEVIGDIGVDADCVNPIFRRKIIRSPNGIRVTADAGGAIWLIAGTDSGFEGITNLFYTQITAVLTPQGG